NPHYCSRVLQPVGRGLNEMVLRPSIYEYPDGGCREPYQNGKNYRESTTNAHSLSGLPDCLNACHTSLTCDTDGFLIRTAGTTKHRAGIRKGRFQPASLYLDYCTHMYTCKVLDTALRTR